MKRKDKESKSERKVFRSVDRTEKDPFLIPEEYLKIDPAQMEELQMPKGSVGYTIASSNATGILICFEVPEETAMPFDSPESLVDILHGSMDDNQGIIEVQNGKCKNGGRYVYYIMKYMYGDGPIPTRTCGYQLNFNFEIDDKVFFISGSFDEAGITGMRESIGIELLAKAKEQAGEPVDMTEIMENNWFRDPYDPDYKKGFLMNRSEDSELDAMFPEHPLSLVRQLVRYVTENN